jgi:hypothetical protein
MALFTAENAAEMAKRGALVKEANKIRKATPELEPNEAELFRRMRLSRVRAQLNAIDGLIAKEMKENCDPAKLDRLASAAIRLNEQERQLSNRSLPPTLKASQVKAKRSSASPIDPEPV